MLAAGMFACGVGLVCAGTTFAQVMIGNWVVTEHDDGASGVHPTARLMADDGANLVVSCDGAGVDIFVSYVDQFPSEATVAVRWKTDGKSWRRQMWAVGPDRGMISSAPSEPSRRLLGELAAAHALSLRVAGHRSTFPLQGIRQIAKLVGSCPGN